MPGSQAVAEAASKPLPGSPPSEQIMPARGSFLALSAFSPEHQRVLPAIGVHLRLQTL